MSTSLPNKSTFIHDQRIYVLTPSDGSKLSLKQALWLTGLPEYGAIDRPYSDWKPDDGTRKYWKIIDTRRSRTEFLQRLGGKEASAFSERRLLCITSSAGIGKTMAVEQTKYLHSTLLDHWVIHYQFDNLPTAPDGFWGLAPMDGSSDSIYERLAKHLDQTNSPIDSPVWKSAVNLLLKSKMEAGQVTIIVDGLDEHDPTTGVSRARALRKFLAQNPRVHCVVAGRPFSITETYWNDLFATNEDCRDDTSPWEFCCVGLFTQDQIRRSLGPNRAERIFSLASELKLTPRTIEVLRTLPDESFARISNLCDVYWESLPGTLNDDVQKKNKASSSANVGGMPTDTYIEYACALAITMFLEEKRQAQYSDIADDLLKRLRTLPKWQAESAESLDKRRESIKMLNAGAIEFRFFDQIDSKVIWRDNTLRDFFAALWMVRYSNDAELEQLIETIPERPRKPDNNEVWEFIASMPVRAMVAGPKSERCKRWLRLTDAVFKQPKTNPRPSQLMWYAWPRLAELTVTNPEISIPVEVPKKAQAIRDHFLAEFEALRKTPESALIIDEDLIFEPIKPLDNGSWNIAVGHPDENDNQPRWIELSGPYSVSKYPITRRTYKLFDHNHEVYYHDDFKKHCKEQRCPVICVNWYDAQMFAIWSKSRLPTEWEWEYACRANQSVKDPQKKDPEHWRVDPIDDEALAKIAWIYVNSQNHTWPVNAKEDRTHTNDFQLVDMLGNVFEWTNSQYSEGSVSRVLRGGSFGSNGRLASASVRRHSGPTDASVSIGFRVARAP